MNYWILLKEGKGLKKSTSYVPSGILTEVPPMSLQIYIETSISFFLKNNKKKKKKG
jgi:hypothetical protein